MGVSAESGNPDLSALMAGGDAFLKRVAEWKAAKEGAEKALADLKLGQSAQAANDKAQQALVVANEQRDKALADLDAEIKNAREQVSTWATQTKDDANKARAEAYRIKEQHQALKDAAEQDREVARAALIEADKTAAKVLADAKAEAGKIVADAKTEAVRLTKDLDKAKAEAIKARNEAQALSADLTKRIDVLQSAASAVLK